MRLVLTVDFIELTKASVSQRVGGLIRRVRKAAQALGVVEHIRRHDVVFGCGRVLIHPPDNHSALCSRGQSTNSRSHSISPSLTQATSFQSLQATASAAASETVSNAVSHLMDDDVVLHGSVPVDLDKPISKS